MTAPHLPYVLSVRSVTLLVVTFAVCYPLHCAQVMVDLALFDGDGRLLMGRCEML